MSEESKYVELVNRLRQFEKLAIAFSGGVDSTLLLHAALEVLKAGNVVAFFAHSSLISSRTVAQRNEVIARNFPHGVDLRIVLVDPLEWQEFVVNDKNRCYFCKKRMYTTLQLAMGAAGYNRLADGTNCDDILESRPGLEAIRELDVLTPLADVGLAKTEIRRLAERFGLSNFAMPSNSCLATRVPLGQPITAKILDLIDQAENFLHLKGFMGCRVRIGHAYTIIEVRREDVAAFMDLSNREEVQAYFKDLQLPQVALNLIGR
ncbi:MAG: ATP-dependent sacrificial sulfur transferase LarE [Desulforhopalus sp.]|nr:ATP-dependent sacrificial sulfur transferase LarE [Desulforhopalus sp.]